jgi:hypothetical protein
VALWVYFEEDGVISLTRLLPVTARLKICKTGGYFTT